MKRTAPAQERAVTQQGARITRRPSGIHTLTTEAQTLDQAIMIIENRQINEKRKATLAAARAGKKPTLKQELARAKLASWGRSISLAGGAVAKGKGTVALEKMRAERGPKRPHPLKDLPDEEKQRQAVEKFRSGAWGLGAKAGRDLAKAFGVERETMAKWLGIEIWSPSEFNDLMVARKRQRK